MRRARAAPPVVNAIRSASAIFALDAASWPFARASQNKKAACSPKRVKLSGNHMDYTGVTIAP
jgi:galactokinase